MKTINLRWIYPHYRHDEFVEVSDEVWEVMRQAQREMNNYERRKVYHRAYYSLDAYSWTENYALEHGRSPEEILLEREERAARLRLIAARERKMYRYKAFYSLDCDDGIENAAIGWAQPSPEDCLMEKEAQAEYAELLRRLYEAISSLTPAQARRVHARYMLGMKVKDIAAMEGITPSQAGKSIHAALRRLRRYFMRRKWTSGL